MKFSHSFAHLILASACILASGCDLNMFVADTTGALLHQAAPSIDAQWDYELAGDGLPGILMQLEAFYSVTPDNEKLALDLAKGYVGYSLGWVENEYQVEWANGNVVRADRVRQRARLLYMRARNLALHTMRVRDPGFEEAMKGGEQQVSEYLHRVYRSRGDVAPIFWAGMAWGAAINLSLDDPMMIVDLPVAKLLVQRAFELDDLFFNGGAYLFLATAEATMPAAMGGDPERARQLFEQGLARTGRKNHMLLVNFARIYAVNTQQRDLYHRLLMEVVESEDLGPSVRLTNKIARLRAERYLEEEHTLF